MKESIGVYINRVTQDEHEIFEVIDPVIKPSPPSVQVLQIKTYRTKSGINVKSVDDELASFKLNESIIHKKST